MLHISQIVLLYVAVVLSIVLAYPDPASANKRVVHVKIGEYCDLGSAPGPDGSFQVVEKDVEKVCAAGSSCRNGACNCDDLPDGSIMGLDYDPKGEGVCRKVAGQKCSADTECFHGNLCLKDKCVCPQDVRCVDKKNDVYILD